MYFRRSPQSFVLGARDVLKVLKKPVLPVGKVEVCTLILFSNVVIQSNVRENEASLLYCSPFKFNLTIHGDIEENPGPPTHRIPFNLEDTHPELPNKTTLRRNDINFIHPSNLR
ncbi:hypothetical protein RCL1_000355 [Eukaryota sp. TZLM3-RCL]